MDEYPNLNELAGLQNIINTSRALHMEYTANLRYFWGGEPPKLTRRKRIAQRFWVRQRDARRRLALFIAPWLDYD